MADNIINNGGKQTVKKNINIKVGSTIIVIGLIVFIIWKNFIAAPEKQIIGTWQTESGYTIVFNEDGSFSRDGGWYGSYRLDGNSLILSPVMNSNEIYTIKISTNNLKIYFEEDDFWMEFTKLK